MLAQEICSAPTVLSASSGLGHIAVALGDGQLVGVSFGHRTASAAKASLLRRATPCSGGGDEDDLLAADLLDRLVRYADGEPVDFRDVPVASDQLTPFARRVVKACRAIPRGQTRTYGELAAAAGRPGAARAVGQVMATNRVPLVVPCHRVVGADGRLGGFSAPDGLTMKRRLLALEA